ncbi:hypothetical protein CRG98_001819 [Punica granatum]|uniref:ABC transporter domain-containing protein n=1 Tax=Punica granatum TaxID=22663 RepID=A0A2I0LAS5_PUNGR|nr:hypothetical protein CRG98_001819 [Punica granatum]
MVRIRGRDIWSDHLRSLRRHLALVGQEPSLFEGTIKENIIFGVSNSDINETEQSGGQKQWISIARVLLKNPVVLLLDEATSALDSLSEEAVQGALEQVMVGRTTVMVAHRLGV